MWLSTVGLVDTATCSNMAIFRLPLFEPKIGLLMMNISEREEKHMLTGEIRTNR
jgi:hypothetical protein